MRWADALKASKIGRAERKLVDREGHEGTAPNVILLDPKFPKAPKLFRAVEHVAWQRVKLREADKYDDWEPVDTIAPGGDDPTQRDVGEKP